MQLWPLQVFNEILALDIVDFAFTFCCCCPLQKQNTSRSIQRKIRDSDWRPRMRETTAHRRLTDSAEPVWLQCPRSSVINHSPIKLHYGFLDVNLCFRSLLPARCNVNEESRTPTSLGRIDRNQPDRIHSLFPSE